MTGGWRAETLVQHYNLSSQVTTRRARGHTLCHMSQSQSKEWYLSVYPHNFNRICSVLSGQFMALFLYLLQTYWFYFLLSVSN